jgi:hypothetical protein
LRIADCGLRNGGRVRFEDLEGTRLRGITSQVALPLQRLQVVEDAARDEAEMRADLAHRRWVSSLRHELPDAIEHFALSGGER